MTAIADAEQNTLTDPQQRIDAWLTRFEAALTARDIAAVTDLFEPGAYWRDLVSFTWNLHTSEGRDQISAMLTDRLDEADPSTFATTDPATGDDTAAAFIGFETGVGRGKGHLRVRPGDDGVDRAWTLLTTLRELKGHEESFGERRPMGAVHGAHNSALTWADRREREEAELGRSIQPDTLVIGGGQGGIALGARLRQLGVPALVIDKYDRPGDQWRGRYKSLCLHDPVWYDHLPYLPFPANWPVFAPKDKIGDWLEMYTRVMEVPYWSRTEALSASYDEAAGEWTVEVIKVSKDEETGDEQVERLTLRPKQLVLATGMSGKPNIPDFPGMDDFQGEQHHSSKHPGPDAYAGKKVVVIGANNSALDISKALIEAGAEVTMVQRSSTHIIKSESLMEHGLGDLYSERAVANGVTTDKADMIFASLPYRIMNQFQKPIYDKVREIDADFYKGLEDAGYELDFGDDDSGLFMKYLRRGSGYYIDVGAAGLIIDGSIKLAKGGVDHLTEDSVVLKDGTVLPADLVVYATGYGSMNGWAADLMGQETADRLGKCWGLGSETTKDPGPWEGEQRNMWKPTRVPGLWMMGGNLHQSRHYSLYLALQLKARYEGIETPVYRLAEVHHTS